LMKACYLAVEQAASLSGPVAVAAHDRVAPTGLAAPCPSPMTVTSPSNNRRHMRKHYIALVHKDPDSNYGISFPDFPGAVTAARSRDEALERAGEALAVHVEGMAEDGEPIPPPSGFAEVIRDNPDAMTVLVPFPLARTVQRG
jgi:predicted RNase H-like HicB family nuclease